MSGEPKQASPEPSSDDANPRGAGPSASASQLDGASSAQRNHLPAIPGYEVLGRLGAGGMGIVYKARHLALNRLVAIKVLNRIQQATEREILRLQMEGETVANLQHPNIVPLYQMGEFAGLPFLTFEYIDGGTLADRIGGRPQPPRKAAELVELLARAVQLAHQQGVLHRDLKPANVLLSKDGVPKIADFGLARRLDNHEFSTELIAGTANYMSPEQAWGDSKTNPLTPATDVYSLGAILYELLTGRPPFAGDSREQTIKDVWSKAPTVPRSLAANVPLDLQTICLKCLEKEPNRRYSSALELADDLHRWLSNEPIVARPTTRFERAVLWCRRDPVFAGVLAALVVAILAGAIGSSWLAVIYREQRVEADAAAFGEKKAAFEAKYSAISADKARAVAEDRQKQLTAANDQLERRIYEAMILTTARDVELMNLEPHGTSRTQLAAHLSQCPPRLRDIEWNIRDRQMQGSLLTRPVTRHSLVAMDVSTDGKWVATGAINMEDYLKGEPVRVWSTNDWQLHASFGRHGQRLTFTPNSQLLAVDDPSTGVEIWNWRESRLIHTFPRPAPRQDKDKLGHAIVHPLEGQVTFSPDGRLLAIGLGAKVRLYPVQRGLWGENQYERLLPTAPVMAMQFCPDSQRLVVLAFQLLSEQPSRAWRSELQIWNVSTGEPIRKLPLEGTFDLMCVSPDGRRCAVGAVRSLDNLGPLELKFCDLVDGTFRTLKVSSRPQAIKFSHDGSSLLVANQQGAVDVIDVDRLKIKSSLIGHIGMAVLAVDSLSDGRIVSAGADGLVKVWPRDAQGRLPRWFDGDRPYALSRDGCELAVAQTDGTVRRFDLNDDRELPRLPAEALKQPAGARVQGDPNQQTTLGIAGLCYAPTAGQLMVAYSDLGIRTWRLSDKQVMASVSLVGPGVTRPSPDLAHASGYFSATTQMPRIVFSDDAKYAAWPGSGQNKVAGHPVTTLMVWEVTSGRTIINEQSRLFLLGPDLVPRKFEFATIGQHTWAVFSENASIVEVPGHPYDPIALNSGWNLTTGQARSDRLLALEVRAARGSRSIEAGSVLTISETANGLLLLQLPIGAKAVEQPRLSVDRSRLAVATDRGIAVFDVGPPPAFSLSEDKPAPSVGSTDKSVSGGLKWSHVDHATIPY